MRRERAIILESHLKPNHTLEVWGPDHEGDYHVTVEGDNEQVTIYLHRDRLIDLKDWLADG